MATWHTILAHLPGPLRRHVRNTVLPPVMRAARRLARHEADLPRMRRYQRGGDETFGGYHDVRPVSADGTAVLAHVSTLRRRSPGSHHEVEVGYFERETGRFVTVGRTRLWCWQLGARLRWWPGEERALAFNTLRGNGATCSLARGDGRLECVSDRALFDVSADGRVGLALNFGRLARTRPGYGYPALRDPFEGEWLPAADGVQILNLASGQIGQLVPLPDIAALEAEDHNRRYHYLNSGFLSPSGRRFCVLHKQLADPERIDTWTVRAIVGGSDGSDLHVVPLPGPASHSSWLDDDRIAYTVSSMPLDRKETYFHYQIPTRELTPLHPAAPLTDGHPSRDPFSGRWVTDSYPDLHGEQAIHVLERDGACITVARLRVARGYVGEWRCDLHPRWASDRTVIVDSTHEGARAMYEVPVPPPL